MNADLTKIIEGSKLMLFLNGKSVAFATNHTISISGETTEISNKDIGSGDWSANAIKKFSWEVTTENMYSMLAYKKLLQLMLAKQPINAIFSVRKDSLISDPSTYFAGWTWKYTNSNDLMLAYDMEYYHGKVLITSLDTQAPNDDNATFSCTMTGTGELGYFKNDKPSNTSIGNASIGPWYNPGAGVTDPVYPDGYEPVDPDGPGVDVPDEPADPDDSSTGDENP